MSNPDPAERRRSTHRVVFGLSLFLIFGACQGKRLSPKEGFGVSREEGFHSLFRGENLEGWERHGGQARFLVKDGCILGRGVHLRANSFLCTKKVYLDFDFRFEMRFDDLTGNSGMMFRAKLRPKGDRVFGYQCEHDNRSRNWSGGLYDEARRGWLSPAKGRGREVIARQRAFTAQGLRIFHPSGWNRFRIVCKGERVRIWLNGELRVDYRDADPRCAGKPGFFGLQVHAGPSCRVRWRNLRIREF